MALAPRIAKASSRVMGWPARCRSASSNVGDAQRGRHQLPDQLGRWKTKAPVGCEDTYLVQQGDVPSPRRSTSDRTSGCPCNGRMTLARLRPHPGRYGHLHKADRTPTWIGSMRSR